MIDFDNENLAKNLPDAFAKDSDSNNYKILENEKYVLREHLEDLWEIYTILDIDNATGETLDRYGERVGQARGLANDAQYLFMIKARIMRNLGNGSYPSVLQSLVLTFGCDPDKVYIEETDNPCQVAMVTMPLDILNTSGMTVKQVSELVKTLLPICVTMDTLSLQGTFTFSDSENEYNELEGFNDVEGGNIGGYLGYMSSDENEPILPI